MVVVTGTGRLGRVLPFALPRPPLGAYTAGPHPGPATIRPALVPDRRGGHQSGRRDRPGSGRLAAGRLRPQRQPRPVLRHRVAGRLHARSLPLLPPPTSTSRSTAPVRSTCSRYRGGGAHPDVPDRRLQSQRHAAGHRIAPAPTSRTSPSTTSGPSTRPTTRRCINSSRARLTSTPCWAWPSPRSASSIRTLHNDRPPRRLPDHGPGHDLRAGGPERRRR